MKFRRANGGELWIATEAVAIIRAHTQRHPWSCEAGGILLGRLLVEGGVVVVDQVGTPSSEDRRSRFRFFRARRPSQTAVDDAWTTSGGELNYLGEWHTHPEDDPEPSSHDRHEWQKLVTTATYEQESLFFVIAGRKGIGAWEINRLEGKVIPLLKLAEPTVPPSSEQPPNGPERGRVRRSC